MSILSHFASNMKIDVFQTFKVIGQFNQAFAFTSTRNERAAFSCTKYSLAAASEVYCQMAQNKHEHQVTVFVNSD